MEAIILNIGTAISESRFWLMPLILACMVVILACMIGRDVQEEMDEWRGK
jgi:hypothetical protein